MQSDQAAQAQAAQAQAASTARAALDALIARSASRQDSDLLRFKSNHSQFHMAGLQGVYHNQQ